MDVDALKALILSQQQQLRSKDEQLLSKDQQLLSKDEQLLSRDHEIEHLKLLIAKLQRMQFGRKSEKVERQIEQLTLKLEELETSRAEHEPEQEPAPASGTHARQPRRRRNRRGVHFLNTFCASPRCMSLRSRRARSVAAHCRNWVRTSRKCSTTFRPAFSSFAMCVPS